MTATLNPALRDYWETRETPAGDAVRFRIAVGGRMSGKSHDFAGMAIARANFFEQRFLCLRMFQNRISDSVYTLLKDKIYGFGLEGNFRIYKDAIEHKRNGSLFRFYGMARNIDEIKSFEKASVAWIEEAHNLTEDMFQAIRPTIMRNDGAEMWFTFNPKLRTDYAYQRLVINPPAGALVRMINYDENKFLGETALADIEAEKQEDYELFKHIYLGQPLENDDDAVIKMSWIDSAIDAHLTIGFDDSGRDRLGFDVADSGQDKCATTYAKGSIAYSCDEWKAGEDELLKSCTRAYHSAREHDAEVVYDSIGVGATVGAKLNELGYRKHQKFNAGATVNYPDKFYQPKIKNKDFFANLKAQAWWMVADRFRLTHQVIQAIQNKTPIPKYNTDDLISISSDMPMLEKLKYELATPKRDFDKAGRVMVESKKDLAKRDIKSPNIADSFIMAFAPVNKPFHIPDEVL